MSLVAAAPELHISVWIPWCNTMQIQLLISSLYKQLISCLPAPNDVLTNTGSKTLQLINSKS